MATLASINKSTSYADHARGGFQEEEKKKPIDWLQRLGGYKLVYWRLGNDLFALREQLEKTKAKLARLDPIEGRQKQADLLLYQVNLETRQVELEKRKDKIRRRMKNRSLDSLDEREWQWWNFMEPVEVLRSVPEHLHYWIGSTEKNSVNYTRIVAGKRQKDGQLLWCINETALPDEVTYPVEAIGKGYTFESRFDVNDVMMDYWWNGIIPHFKKAG